MKAIVVFQKGGNPQFVENFPEPTLQNSDQLLLSVKATAIKHLDRATASGTHYSTENDLSQAKVVGVDGAGILEDGTRVFALGITGMMAEKAIIEKSKMIKLPEGLDYALAAALPNAVSGSAMALLFRAKFSEGETVLINGATGFTGRIAVQLAKLYGAGKIIATGRDEQSLQQLLALGADEIIKLDQDEKMLANVFMELHKKNPIDIIIDYVWGRTAELILDSLKGQGNFTHRTRYVTVGSMAGDSIKLSGAIMRSVDLHLTGSGMGSWSKEELKTLLTEILPQTFQLAVEGKLHASIKTISIDDMQNEWNINVQNGSRVVALL